MICEDPFRFGVIPCGCGKCLPCKINRRRIWTTRMIMELAKVGKGSFITLTYNEENVPKSGSLVPKDATLFIKRLRKSISPVKVRYYLAGEYGEKGERPHYHIALFGVNPEEIKCKVEKTWKKGFSMIGSLNKNSVQYIAGYVLKKKFFRNDPRLKGRYPEYSRMSRRPGIGAGLVERIVHSLPIGSTVPAVLKIGKQLMPVGRYIRGKIREKAGNNVRTKDEELTAFGFEMRFMQEERDKERENKANACSKAEYFGYVQQIRNAKAKIDIYRRNESL